MTEWINIKDQMPDQGSKVLCTDGTDIEIARITNQFEFVPNDGSRMAYSGVTYWMYLPELPKQ